MFAETDYHKNVWVKKKKRNINNFTQQGGITINQSDSKDILITVHWTFYSSQNLKKYMFSTKIISSKISTMIIIRTIVNNLALNN